MPVTPKVAKNNSLCYHRTMLKEYFLQIDGQLNERFLGPECRVSLESYVDGWSLNEIVTTYQDAGWSVKSDYNEVDGYTLLFKPLPLGV